MAEDKKQGPQKPSKKAGEEHTGTRLPAMFTARDTAAPRRPSDYESRAPGTPSNADEERADTLPDSATARIPLAPEERQGARETIDLRRVPTQQFYGLQREPESPSQPFTEAFVETSGDTGAFRAGAFRQEQPSVPAQREPTPERGLTRKPATEEALDEELPYARTLTAEELGTRAHNRLVDVKIRDTLREVEERVSQLGLGDAEAAHLGTLAGEVFPEDTRTPEERMQDNQRANADNLGKVYDMLLALSQERGNLTQELGDAKLPDRLHTAKQRFWRGQYRQPELVLQRLADNPLVKEYGPHDAIYAALDVIRYQSTLKQMLVSAETVGEIPVAKPAVAEPELPAPEQDRHALLLPPDLMEPEQERTGVKQFRGPEDLEGYQPGIPQEMIGTPLVETFTLTSGETGEHPAPSTAPLEQPALPAQPSTAELGGEPTIERIVFFGLAPLRFGRFYEEAVRAGEMNSEELGRALQGVERRGEEERLNRWAEIISEPSEPAPTVALQTIPKQPAVSQDLFRIIEGTLAHLGKTAPPQPVRYFPVYEEKRIPQEVREGQVMEEGENRERFTLLDGRVEQVERQIEEQRRFGDDIERMIFGIDMPRYPVIMGVERQRIAGEGDYFYLGRYLVMEELTRLSEAVLRLRRIRNERKTERILQERREQLFEQFFGVRKEAAERSKIDRAYTYLMRALEHGKRADDPQFLTDDLEIEGGRKTFRERRLEEYGAALRDLHTVWKIKPETPFLQRKRLDYTHAVLDLMESAEQKGNIREYQTGVHALQYCKGSWDLFKAYVLGGMKQKELDQHFEALRDWRTEQVKRQQQERKNARQAVADLVQGRIHQIEGEDQRGILNLLDERIQDRKVYEAKTPLILSGVYAELNRIPELGSLCEPNYRPLKFNNDGEIVFGMEVVPELPEGMVARERALEKPYDVLFAQEVAPPFAGEEQLSFAFPEQSTSEYIVVVGVDTVREAGTPVKEEYRAPTPAPRRTFTPQEVALAMITGRRIPFVIEEESGEIIEMTDDDIVGSELASVEQCQPLEETFVLLGDTVADNIMPLEEIELRPSRHPSYQEVAMQLHVEAQKAEARGNRQALVDLIAMIIPKREAEDAVYHQLITAAYFERERKREQKGEQLELDASLVIAERILEGIQTEAQLDLHYKVLIRLEPGRFLMKFKIDDLVVYADPNAGRFLARDKISPEIEHAPWEVYERIEEAEAKTVLRWYANAMPSDFADDIARLLGFDPVQLQQEQQEHARKQLFAVLGARIAQLEEPEPVSEKRTMGTVQIPTPSPAQEQRKPRAMPPPLPPQVFEPTPEERAYLATFYQRAVFALEGRDYDVVMDARKVFMATVRALEAVEEGKRVLALPAPAYRKADIAVHQPAKTARQRAQEIADRADPGVVGIIADTLTIMNRGEYKEIMTRRLEERQRTVQHSILDLLAQRAEAVKTGPEIPARKREAEERYSTIADEACLAVIYYHENNMVEAFHHTRNFEQGVMQLSHLRAYPQIIEDAIVVYSAQLKEIKEYVHLVVDKLLEEAEGYIKRGEVCRDWAEILPSTKGEAREWYGKARENFEQVLQYDPENTEARGSLNTLEQVVSEMKRGDVAAKVRGEQERTAQQEPTADDYFDRGLKAHEEERLRPAEAWYNAALKLDPQHVLALTNLGLVALEEGDYEKALQLQLKAVDASAEKAEIPDGLERSADKLEYAPAVVKLHLADTYAANEKPREAQATYKRVLKDHAGTEYEVDAFMGLAEVARSKDDQRQAVHYLDEARDVAEVLGMPTHQIDYNLGTLLQHQEFTESARASYEQAVAGAPFGEEPHYENRSSRLVEGFALNNLGVLATGEGDQEEARLYFEHAKQANPNDVLPVINVSNLQ